MSFMKNAISLAKKASDMGEIPVGAVIVKDNEIIASAYNTREADCDATAHAEILAITKANEKLNSWRLDDCDIYVTLEPCPMCTGAIINSRIKKVVFGASDYKAGSMGSVINLCDLPYNHKPEVISGVLKDECAESPRELEQMLGLSRKTVSKQIWYAKKIKQNVNILKLKLINVKFS